MSHPSSPPRPLAAASPAPASPVSWPDAARQAAFEQWLAPLVQSHQLLPASLRPASADASFRRYLRIDSAAGASCIEIFRDHTRSAGALPPATLLFERVPGSAF